MCSPADEAQPSESRTDAVEGVPLSNPPPRDVEKSSSSKALPQEGASQGATSASVVKGQGPGATNVDEFNAMDIASNIAKEVVKEAGGSGEGPEEVERVEDVAGPNGATATMNQEPAQEIESPVGSPRADSPLPDLSKVGSATRKKRRLRKKIAKSSPSSSQDRTPSPPRDEDVVQIPSSTEKSTLGSKSVPESNASESSDMEDLGESSEENEEASGGSRGKSSSDIFAGMEDIFLLPSFTPSKLLIPSRAYDSELPRDDVDQGEKPLEEGGSVGGDQREKQLEEHGNLGHSQSREEASGSELPKHSLFPDAQGSSRWNVKASNIPVLHVLEKQFPSTFTNFSASRLVGGSLLDILGEMVLSLQRTTVRDFSDEEYEDIASSISDMERLGLDLQWLRDYLSRVRTTKMLFASLFKVQTSAAQFAEAKETREKYKQLLAEAEEKVSVLEASHKLLVQDHQALEARPKTTLSDIAPVLPPFDSFSQELLK